ncbi:ABC transporter permease [Flexivirga sp. B27]
MTAAPATTTDAPTPTPPTTAAPTARPTPVGRVYRFEVAKLLSQWRIRVLVAACWIAPALFVAGVSQQSSLPVDTLFGRWMDTTGWAGPLVTLGFSGTWALPLLTSVVAGDIFTSEDRLGTWRHLLVAVRSPGRIFAAKGLSSLTVLLAMIAGLAISSSVAGVLVVGNNPLIGLDGHTLSAGEAAVRVALAWACVLAPTLALAGLGLLGSVLFGRSPMGLLLPAVVAFAMQLALMLPLPVAVRLALPGSAFLSWNGLFTEPAQLGPILVGVVVSLVWAVAATALAYTVFVRRDFSGNGHDTAGRRAITIGLTPIAALLVLGIAAIAPFSSVTDSGITQAKVNRSVATAFAHLYRLQTTQLHRPAVTEQQLRTSAACNRGGGSRTPEGAGNDWRCVVSWRLPGSTAVGRAIYQLDLHPDGRFMADGDGPKQVNGYFLVRTPDGDAPNPLWQFDANVDLLSTPK